MKVETPQILWNNQSDSRVPAALYSVSILESGLVANNCGGSSSGTTNAAGSPGRATSAATDMSKHGIILATAGSTHEVNLWSIAFSSDIAATTSKPIFQRKTNTKMNYMCSLSRHERTVNVVRFSPNGLHLATAGDSGTIIVWSVPVSKRGGNNGRHFWSTVTKETELTVRIVAGNGDGVCDICWSADSKRFAVGTVDHCFVVYEDAYYDSNQQQQQQHQTTSAAPSLTITTEKPQSESQWKAVFRSTSDHSNFIQGVAYDPLGVYLSSMSSDRSVKVYARKVPTKSKKKVLRPSNAPKGPLPPTDHQQMVMGLLTESKFQVGKAKTIKYRKCALEETGAQVKHHLFADESTMESFFRRLSWTNDGAFLIAPAGLWHSDPLNLTSKVPPAFATLLFARHRFDQPCKVLYGLEKPAVVVRPHPKLFQLPTHALNESKENHSPDHRLMTPPSASASSSLPYRSIFAVLTVDSVLVYDTHHNRPLALIKGLHYAALTDCVWSPDGKSLVLCSSDGYISFVHFADGELGEIYEPPKVSPALPSENTTTEAANIMDVLPFKEIPPLPPCEPGQKSVLEAPPAKRAKKTRIVPVLLSSLPSMSTPAVPTAPDTKGPLQGHQPEPNLPEPSPAKRTADQQGDTETDRVGLAVTKLSLECNSAQPPKKKKRIQPTLISMTNNSDSGQA